MATTLNTGTLKVTIFEHVSLNGKNQGSRNEVSIGSIASVFSRILNVPTSEVTLYTTDASTIGGSQLDEDNIKYVRITNKDNTNFVTLTIKNDRDEETALKLAAYHSFILWGHKDALDANQVELSFTNATVDTTNGAFTAACDSSSKIKIGQAVSGAGVVNGATVATVNTPGAVTSFTMSSEANDTETNTTITFAGDMADITSITALANSSACDVEVFVAST